MSDKIVIEKNPRIPTFQNRKAYLRAVRNAVDEMQVGNAIVVSDSSARATALSYGKAYGRILHAEKEVCDGKFIHRIWRKA